MLEGGEPGEETPLNRCGVGILGMITVNTRLQVTGRKLEFNMRNLVFEKLVAELWNLRRDKKSMLGVIPK